METTSPELPLLLGCPVWNCDQWSDIVYPNRTPRRDWLKWYSRCFNTVEGNSTFYGLPALDSVQRWCQDTLDGFRFCLKFPRSISHELALVHAERETEQFLRIVETLASGNRLGPSFLQLGPDFGPDRIAILERYLERLPKDYPWAVEVRHPGWFDQSTKESSLTQLLAARAIDWVIFDSRALYQLPPEDAIERESQQRKPKTPLRNHVTGRQPMLRLIGRNRLELVDDYIEYWADTVAIWVRSGLRPIVFTHAPDDAHAPAFARRFWKSLRIRLQLASKDLPAPPPPERQLELF